MADRVVRVKLEVLTAEYLKGMQEAAEATREARAAAEKLAQQREAFQTLGTAGVVMGGAIAAGIGMAVSKFAEFDQAMSFVAATGDDARGSLVELRQAALDAGADTVFSATESANAIEEMAKAGVNAKDILGGGLTGALDLAAAGGLGVADAAGIAATALQVFNLEGSDMSHVADLLAAGAGKAMGDVSDLSAALAQGGQVAAATGLSIEETTAGLAAFASQGLLGSDAGTSFKSMLQRLTPQSKEAANLMSELGISAYDASGNFVGLSSFAGNLQESLKKLTPEQRNSALATIFGSDAVRAANVLYQEGAEGIDEWTKAVDDQGYAAETAATRLDNLAGDVEALGGAFDTALIQSGAALDGAFRAIVQGVTALIDAYNGLPGPLQAVVTWFGLLTAGILVAGGTALLAVPKFAELKTSLDTLGISGSKAADLIGKVTAVAGGVAAGVGVTIVAADALTKAFANIGASAEEVQNKLATATSGADAFGAVLSRGFGATDDIEVAEKAVANLADMIDRASSGMQELDGEAGSASGMVFAKQATDKLNVALSELAGSNMQAAQAQFRKLADEAGLSEDQMAAWIDLMPDFKKHLVESATAAGDAADAQTLVNIAMGEAESVTKDAADAYLEQASATEEANNQLEQLIETFNEANGVARDAISANADWQAALAGLTDQVNENGSSLDEATVAGSANAAALADVAQAAQEAASAQFEQDQATMSAKDAADKYSSTLAAQRQAFIDSATAAGFNADEVQALADQVFALPDEKAIEMLINTANAQWTIDRFIAANSSKRVNIAMGVGGSGGQYAGNEDGGFYGYAFASGGIASNLASGIYPGGAEIHKFAERSLPWEAYISPKADQRQRNIGIWQETGRRLGVGGGDQALIAEVRALRGALGRPSLNIINPVARDLQAEAWDAAQTIGIER